MRVLVVGAGAREHALLWKLARSPRVSELLASDTNEGFREFARGVAFPPNDPDAIMRVAVRERVDLAVVGPENAMEAGVTDALRSAGVPTFGASRAASRLEWGRGWSKDLMRAEGIPQARYERFDDSEAARRYLWTTPHPVVVKADGLALGKGSFICADSDESTRVVGDLMDRQALGPSGSVVVVEEFLQGPEFSYMFFTDGTTIRPAPTSQDHKRLGDNDRGPNTGGMGVYTPVFPAASNVDEVCVDRIGQPLLRGLQRASVDFRGVITVNAMLTEDGPKVLEANARFGSPECELVMPMLQSDLVDVMEAVEGRRLHDTEPRWRAGAGLVVVLAARGYPGEPQRGDVIHGLDDGVPGTVTFHGGTQRRGDAIVTNGGRVLVIGGYGPVIEVARAAAYERVNQISFDGMQYRTDLAAPSRITRGPITL